MTNSTPTETRPGASETVEECIIRLEEQADRIAAMLANVVDKLELLLVPLDHARSKLGIGRTAAYRLAREHGELVPGLPVFRIRGRQYVNRVKLERAIEKMSAGEAAGRKS